MNIATLPSIGLFTFAVFCGLMGVAHFVRSVVAREQLVTRSEDLGADLQVLSDPLRRKSLLVRWADRYDRSAAAAPHRELLRKAYLPWKPSTYRMLHIGTAAAIAGSCIFIVRLHPAPALLLGVAIYLIAPKMFFSFRRDAFIRAFDDQTPDVAQILANALQAGTSIRQALGHLVERIEEPAKSEFRQAHHELLLGDDLAKVLTSLNNRVKSKELKLLVDMIIVQHRTGGNLARVLIAMTKVVTERHQVRNEAAAIMRGIRYTLLTIMAAPLLLLVMVRDTMIGEALFESYTGWIMLAVYFVVQIIIFLVIHRAMRIEV